VSHTKRTGQFTGTITAEPNPILFSQENVVIRWETNDPAGGEVRVSTAPADEKLVSKGRSGRTEIPWIVDSATHDVRLYSARE
jgi:hypothetical protein